MSKKAPPKHEPEVAKAKGKPVKPPTTREKLIDLKKRMGRPPFVPTDADRELVQMLAVAGVQHNRIANHIGIDEKTLRKYFAYELDSAHDIAVAESINLGLIQQAKLGNVTAAIFVAKTQAGWREQPTQLEIDSKGGPTAEDKKALVQQVMQMLERRAAPEPTTIDVTPNPPKESA